MEREVCLSERLRQIVNQLVDFPPFQKGVAALGCGKSITFERLVGDSNLLLASALAQALFVSSDSRDGEPPALLLIVAATPGEADRIVDELPLFTDLPVSLFPSMPEAFFSQSSTAAREIWLASERLFGERLRVLKTLNLKDPSVPARIVVTTSQALSQPVPDFQKIESLTRSLKVGEEANREEWIRWLLDGGFHNVTAVELPGEYSVRGGILDIFPLDGEHPVRIEFFGDEIDSIRPFDQQTQRSIGDLREIEITVISPDSEVNSDFLFDDLPKQVLTYLIDTEEILRKGTEYDRFQVESRKRKSEGTESPSRSSQPIASGLARNLTFAETMNRLYRFPTAHSVSIATGGELTDETISLEFQSVERFTTVLEQIKEEFNLLLPGINITLFCQSEAEIERLKDLFQKTRPGKNGEIHYELGPLTKGFASPPLNQLVLGSAELFRRTTLHRAKKRTLSTTIDSFLDLKPGDLVIHVSHGLARFLGLRTLPIGDQNEEQLVLEFADDVLLYVPVSKIALVQKYVGTGKNVKLAKINGKLWAKQKSEVRNAVFDLAAEMIDLQAQRKTRVGTAFPPDSDWQRDFEESFPFDETDDQLEAIASIKEDMEQSAPMDRLLCGDVGFGKTEVAVRAAFKAVDAGYQVAVLVPTTILAEQHYRVFSERMAPFPIRIAALSRFTEKKQEKMILERLQTGEIDIVIGTHRIVQKDVLFKNLGLVVIDEEQKFGVRDKDHLKKLRSTVDVLTMTATPIPRTLHYSLLELRSISKLQTPPQDRLPVITRVLPIDPETIRLAILHEISRGGQVYYLHNQVSDIQEKRHWLQAIVPEARIAVGHAQMGDGELEDVMREFLHHRVDVLLCTTIVENGLDITNANTIFIENADRFGLAELHQLRGRVGRFRNQAYCYLLLNPGKPMTTDALKRLRAIEEYSHLGAGFQIAMRDLEIRGAGNILGTQQSGHIAMVGFEMYCDFLDAAVRALKNEPQKEQIEIEIGLPGTTLIPKEYILDQRTKIDFYRRIVRVTKPEELEAITRELWDRFGKPPVEVERLLLHSRIRLAAWKYRIKTIKITGGPGGPFITMKFLDPRLIRILKDRNEPKRIPVRITEDQYAHIPIPPVIMKGGKPNPDDLIYFLLKALEI